MRSTRRGARRTAALTALAAAPLLLSACGGLEGTGDLQYVSGEGNVLEVPPSERGEPVDLSGESLQGEPLDLADSRGEVTVVNVWWSGCGPCRSEMPMLVEAAERMPGTTFVGINTRDPGLGTAQAFEREVGVTYPSLYDDTAAPLLAFPPPYTPQSMPSTVVLDEEGRVGALISGEIPSALTLEQVVESGAGDRASGSGKSTLLSCLAGTDEPDGGTVRIRDKRLSHQSESVRARMRGRNIGLLFQSSNLLAHLTVRQNVALAQRLARAAEPTPVAAVLDSLGIASRAHAYPSQLSGGELARAGLAVALANDPVVLLADEPTGELDHATESAVLNLLRVRAAAGVAVLVASHSPAVAAVADRVVRIADGRVVS